MFDRSFDVKVRMAAFEWLSSQVALRGEVLPRSLLAEGFVHEGKQIRLVGPQGIFKPRWLAVPLSITTAPRGPYHDAFSGGLLHYRYRGSDPDHPDNRGLRFCMEERLPLVYFHGLVPGRYLTTWPVFIVGDRPQELTFEVAVDDAQHTGLDPEDTLKIGEGTEARREYVTDLTRRRLHQRAFRERVLLAYRYQCALCRLRHEELLDAAHIIPDSEPGGEPTVRNGLALCRLHHAAFDRFFLGVRPDHIVEVRRDILTEHDGPTLRYAIQGLHGKRILVPRSRDAQPSVELLEIRYNRFLDMATAQNPLGVTVR